MLTIDHTWDGAPIGDGERATLRLSADPLGLRIEVDAPFHGDPAPSAPPGPTPGLWDFEVVELFIAGSGSDADLPYLEVELGPHGHHLVLSLRGVRQSRWSAAPMAYEAAITGDRWAGVAVVPWAWLPAGPHRGNAYAIHGAGSDRRYLAMSPTLGDKPDFHKPARFVALAMPCAPGACG
jgi:hypothetical protein